MSLLLYGTGYISLETRVYSLSPFCMWQVMWCLCGEAGKGYSEVSEVKQVSELNSNWQLSMRRLSGGLSPQGLHREGPPRLMTVRQSHISLYTQQYAQLAFLAPLFYGEGGSVTAKCGGRLV